MIRSVRDPDYRQDQYDDPEGRALVEAIIERKAARNGWL